MAVYYHNGTGAATSTVKNIMTQLDTLLVQAGWTRQYTDADAATGGVGGAPGWNKTPATNTPAGAAVYSMPTAVDELEDPLSTAWHVRFDVAWGNNTAKWQILITTGTGHSSGTLANPGTQVGILPAGNTAADIMTQVPWFACAGDIGFALIFPVAGSNVAGCVLGLERKRTIQGQVTDDLTLYAATGNTSVYPLQNFGGNNGRCLTRSAAAGEFVTAGWLVFKEPGGSATAVTDPATLTVSNSGVAIPQGPLLTSGGPGGYSRLVIIAPASDVAADVTLPVAINGVPRVFRSMPNTQAYLGGGRLMIATE